MVVAGKLFGNVSQGCWVWVGKRGRGVDRASQVESSSGEVGRRHRAEALGGDTLLLCWGLDL